MFYFLKATYLDLLSFLKTPADQPDPVQSRSEKAKKLLSLLIINIPIMVILMGVLSGLEALGLFKPETNIMTKLLKTISTWPSIFILIFVLVILIPFLEELIFRLYLRYKYNYLAHFFIFMTSIAGVKFHKKTEARVNHFWVKRYKIVFYFSAVLFGLVHLSNYEYSILVILFSPLIVAPQFVVGLFCGYLRVRHGLVWGYFMHAMHNAIFLCIPLIFMASSNKNLTNETDTYSLKIEESIPRPLQSISYFRIDSVVFKNVTLKSILAELLSKDEMLLKSNDEPFINKMIILKYKNKLAKKTSDKKDIDYPLIRKNILDQLSKWYDFKIKNEINPQEVWELYVEDSTLFAKSIADSALTNTVNTSFSEVSATNASMWGVAKGLTGGCKKFIIDKTSTKKRHTLKLQTNDFEALQKQLITEYGLTLKQTTKELEFTTIEF